MRIRPSFRPLLAALCLLCLAIGALAGASWPARADVAVYQVSGIPVDVTADTPTAAREAALVQGHLEAYRRLMARLVLQEDLAYVPSLSQGEIAQLIQDFSVVNEKTSAVRYLADLTFRFKPEEVRNLFRAQRLRFAETRSKPLLVLPVYFTETGEVLLWEDSNLWAFAWALRDLSEELVPLVIPLGDLGDVAAIDVERAVAGDGGALYDIAQRYGTAGVVVAQAGLVGDLAGGVARLDLVADRYDPDVWRLFAGSIPQSIDHPDAEALFARAIDEVVASAQADWKADNHLSFDDERRLSAVVPVNELGDWLEVRRRLSDIASIVDLRLVTMTRLYAQVDIAYIGNEERLSRALAQSDIALSRSALTGWELRLSDAIGGTAIPLGQPIEEDSGGEPEEALQDELQDGAAESLLSVE